MGEAGLYILFILLALLVIASLVIIVILFKKCSALEEKVLAMEEGVEKERTEAESETEDAQPVSEENYSSELVKLRKSIRAIEARQNDNFDKVSITRYSAAGDMGKTSYSVGITNEAGDALVITGLNYGSGTKLYVKTLKEGHADIPLSKEEEATLKRTKLN